MSYQSITSLHSHVLGLLVLWLDWGSHWITVRVHLLEAGHSAWVIDPKVGYGKSVVCTWKWLQWLQLIATNIYVSLQSKSETPWGGNRNSPKKTNMISNLKLGSSKTWILFRCCNVPGQLFISRFWGSKLTPKCQESNFETLEAECFHCRNCDSWFMSKSYHKNVGNWQGKLRKPES